jgi:hypothetical protein
MSRIFTSEVCPRAIQVGFQEKIMSDSWCSSYWLSNGMVLHGGPAREARIAERGGMDRILAECALQNFRKGYGAGAEDANDRLAQIERRLRDLEKHKEQE